MSIQKPELVLLDLDGTLVDSIPDLARCLNLALTDHGHQTFELAAIRNWVGNGVDKLIHRALTKTIDGIAKTERHAKVKTSFMEYYRAEPCQLTDCYPGVREGLQQLTAEKIIMGVVTNKNEEFVEPILAKLGINQFMQIIIGGNTLSERKPHPMPLLHAAEKFNKKPANSMMIGDSISDVGAAKAAGFQIVCVSYGYNHGQDIRDSKPDAVIDSLEEITKLFQAATC
ncbi:MAG: phosphoglycolate phosphatase [Pseudomonadota bacterium]